MKDIVPGSDGSFPQYLTVVDQQLYFLAGGSSDSRRELLWKTDGTSEERSRSAIPLSDLHIHSQASTMLCFSRQKGHYGEAMVHAKAQWL